MMGLLVDLGKGLAALAIVAFLVAEVIAAVPSNVQTYVNQTLLASVLTTILNWAVTIVPLVVVIGLGQWIGIFGNKR